MDPICGVHASWKELKIYSNINWEPGPEDQYKGPLGGPLEGTSKNIIRLACTDELLACLLMSIIPITFFRQVAKLANKYAYKDWVVEKTATDQDVNLETKNCLSQCSGYTDIVETNGHRHIADNQSISIEAYSSYDFFGFIF